MIQKLKNLLIGTPLPTAELSEKKLNKSLALAAFSPDALSSIAYANQEIYLGLLAAGSIGLMAAWPIGLAITIILVIVAISYFQTIHGYPSGAGSYIVARENLGILPGLIAGAALLIDYLLTAAVSLSAGVEAFASAFPSLWDFKVPIALALLLLITVVNLRGVKETGTFMSIPVYLFLFSFLSMLVVGVWRLIQEGPGTYAGAAPPSTSPLTALLILHAFSSGCTALTGIEAISNGVPVFKSPEAKNAGRTLIVMAVLMAVLFLGSIGLTQAFAVVAAPNETILSALARRIVDNSPFYYLVQITTLLILTVAANTSFTGFPRVAAILAKDGFLPRQLTGLGDRLVFQNGILALSAATGVLIIAFRGDTHALVPLFAVGAFLAFTLSQAGMVRHWMRERGKNWWAKMVANGIGALTTGTTLLVVGISKFTQGAWITILVIPLLVIMFLRIRVNYRKVAKQLTLRGLPPSLKPSPPCRLVIPISGVHRGIIDAVLFAESISKDITAVYIELDPGSGQGIRKEWEKWFPDICLVVLPSPYRSIIGPLLKYLDETDRDHHDGQLAAVVLPEFVPARWWHWLLHNQTTWLIKTALLYRRREHGFQRVIIDIPYHLRQ